MNDGSHRFRVGSLECIVVSDGSHTYAPPTFPPPHVLLFANAPGESLGQALQEHDLSPEKWAEWQSPYVCLLVKAGKHLVLVDTGAGNLTPSTGKLLQNLKAERIAPGDIDTVVITHGHPDHIGGIPMRRGIPLSLTPATLYGRTSGTSGLQGRRSGHWTSIAAQSCYRRHARTYHLFKSR